MENPAPQEQTTSVSESGTLPPSNAPAASPEAGTSATRPTKRRLVRSETRRMVESLILFLILVLLLRAVFIEPYGVPTGSMAPALAGNHKQADCPRCGYPVMVGHRGDPGDSSLSRKVYAHACCPNCGYANLSLQEAVECTGDRLMVDKNVFELRPPRRWEMAVFRCPSDPAKPFVKRVAGLPGESIFIQDGDVYIDRALARKTLAEFVALRIPIFDANYPPNGQGWQPRWLTEGPKDRMTVAGKELRLDATTDLDYQWATYRNWLIDLDAEGPIYDTIGYNGPESDRTLAPVHDFMLECDVEVVRGGGWVAFGITDGKDEMLAEMPTFAEAEGIRLGDANGPIRVAPGRHWSPGSTYHVELAFVDRRLTLAIDGWTVFVPIDLDAALNRAEVKRPIKIGGRGVEFVLRNLRLYRDIHYTQGGQHAVRKPCRLGADEYFMLGDNSPNSDDSRFWPHPAVKRSHLLGKPILVHMPSRFVSWEAFGRQFDHQGPDWSRVRVLK